MEARAFSNYSIKVLHVRGLANSTKARKIPIQMKI